MDVLKGIFLAVWTMVGLVVLAALIGMVMFVSSGGPQKALSSLNPAQILGGANGPGQGQGDQGGQLKGQPTNQPTGTPGQFQPTGSTNQSGNVQPGSSGSQGSSIQQGSTSTK